MGLAMRSSSRLAFPFIFRLTFPFAFLLCPVFGLAQETAEPSLQSGGTPSAPSSPWQQSSVDDKGKAEAIAAANEILAESERIIFLGDSNTHAAEYIVQLEAAILETFGTSPEMINLGLGSETCCGLSEPSHPFPRPNVLERLDRAIAKTKPDIVVACYGMNDGIYHPFDKTRFEAYQNGINTIIKKVEASGAKLILLTPPPFDPTSARLAGKLVPVDAKEFSWKTIYENYDSEVLKRYADWILEQRSRVLVVVDTHQPISDYLKQKRKTEPEFAFSHDGVHFDKTGHKVFAQAILDELAKSCGVEAKLSSNEKLIKLVRKRQSISHLAWLSEVKHLRPGVKDGLPMEKAKQEMKPISDEIGSLLPK